MKRMFVPERLRSARIFRGKTVPELAKDIGESAKMIKQYEDGLSIPRLEMLFSVMRALRFPREYFSTPYGYEVKYSKTFYSPRLTNSKLEILSQEERLKLLSEIFIFLEKYVSFPECHLPDVNNLNSEIAAYELRSAWCLGMDPIPDIIKLLEKKGFIINLRSASDSDQVSITKWQKFSDRERVFMILRNNLGLGRQFDAAHQLGHLVLQHEDFITSFMCNEEIRKADQEAANFAGCFLLPEESFLKDLVNPSKPECYIELLNKWRVPIPTMIVRAYKLKAISFDQYRSLMDQINSKKWVVKGPRDSLININIPVVLKRAVDLLLVNDIFTGPELTKKLLLHHGDIEELLNLGSITLREPNSEILELRLVR